MWFPDACFSPWSSKSIATRKLTIKSEKNRRLFGLQRHCLIRQWWRGSAAQTGLSTEKCNFGGGVGIFDPRLNRSNKHCTVGQSRLPSLLRACHFPLALSTLAVAVAATAAAAAAAAAMRVASPMRASGERCDSFHSTSRRHESPACCRQERLPIIVG